MNSARVGNSAVFAIESGVTRAYERPSQYALGYFVIYVGGNCYGVKEPDATMLACSLDEVRDRIARRGAHCASFGEEPNARSLVDAFLSTLRTDSGPMLPNIGISARMLYDAIYENHINWAPDGDEAFDDGSHVWQFDNGDSVRLIAFRNVENLEEVGTTLADVTINADAFYELLETWRAGFEAEWLSMPREPG